MLFLLILLVILILFTMPCMIQIVWNTGVVALFNYFGLTISPITYGIAWLIWLVWTFFFSKKSINAVKDNEEFCKNIFNAYLTNWLYVGEIYLIVIIIF